MSRFFDPGVYTAEKALLGASIVLLGSWGIFGIDVGIGAGLGYLIGIAICEPLGLTKIE